MAWQVKVENVNLGKVELLSRQELTPEKAFNVAKDAVLTWLRKSWNWDTDRPKARSTIGGDEFGPAPGGRFKIIYYTEKRGSYSINARWDYIRAKDGAQETNDIYWSIVEV